MQSNFAHHIMLQVHTIQKMHVYHSKIKKTKLKLKTTVLSKFEFVFQHAQIQATRP